MPSSLLSIPGQPIIFTATGAEPDCNCGQMNQCIMVEPLQDLYYQLQLQPCGTVSVCNNSLGNELVTGGDFPSNASFIASWTAAVNWSWSAGTACSDGQSGTLEQNVGAVNGTLYLVTFDLTVNSGQMTADLGGTSLGGSPFTTSGSYANIVIAGADGAVQFDSDFLDGCLDNVSVKEIISCWNANEITWTTSVGGACHVAGNVVDLTNTGTVITSGLYYHITFVVSGATAGGVTLKANTAAIGAQTSGNGTFDRWGTADGAAIVFTPSNDFDGCISALAVVQYNIDYIFHLLTEDGSYVADLTGLMLLNEDYLTLDGLQLQSLPQVNYGCYKICFIDGCYGDLFQADDNIIDNGDFSAGAAYWASSGVTFAAGVAVMAFGVHAYLEQNIKITTAVDCIRIRLSFLTEGSGVLVISVDGVIVYDVTVAGSGSIDINVANVAAGALIKIEIPGATMDFTIDNVIVNVPAECRVYDQCTPCIKYQAEFDCTNLMVAWCDGEAHNFRFDDLNGANMFKLSQRLKSQFLHPSYEQEQDDYIYSTGESFLSFGQNTKYQSLYFSPIPEFKHDVIAVSKVCDYIQIDAVDYFVKKGDYTPEWNKGTNADLAPSRIEVKKKDQTTFNNNCE